MRLTIKLHIQNPFLLWLLHLKVLSYIQIFWFGLKLEKAAVNWNPYSETISQVNKVQRTVAKSDGEFLDEIEWPSIKARRDRSSCFSYIRFIIVLCLLKKTSA